MDKITEIPFCREIKSSFAGIKLPKSVRFFDCRTGPDQFAGLFKTPYGATLWGSERAAYALGLRKSWTETYDVMPLTCSVYHDLRTCHNFQLEKIVRDMRAELLFFLKEYRKAKQNPARPGEGGSVTYKPAAIALTNFGWSIICDGRKSIVQSWKD